MPSDVQLHEPWASFLSELDAQLTRPTEVHCLGGFVVSQLYGLERPTADVDFPESTKGPLSRTEHCAKCLALTLSKRGTTIAPQPTAAEFGVNKPFEGRGKVPLVKRRSKSALTAAAILTTPQLQEAVSRLEGTNAPSNAVLHAWIKSGLIHPQFDRANGRAGRWTLDDLAVIRIIVRLRMAGISGQRVRLILSQIGLELPTLLRPGAPEELIIDGYRAILRRPGRADREILGGQLRLPLASFVKNNDRVAAAVRAA